MSLKQKSIKGSVSTVSGQMVQFAIQMASITVMARLLGPTEYGKFAIATAVSGVLAIFASGGLSTATMQKPNLSQTESSSMYWLNVALGGALMIALAISGPIVSFIYKDSDYNLIMPLLGAVSFITSFSAQKNAILNREMKFGRIAIANIISQIIGVGSAIIAAYHGWGIWSLILQQFSRAISHNIATYFNSDWKPSFTYKHEAAKPMLRFGASVMFSRLIDEATKSLDSLVIGYFFGNAAVGLYNRAQNILKLPMKKFITPISGVARAAMFRTTDNQERFQNGVFAIVLVISVFSGLIVISSLSLAEQAVLLLLGDQWLDCVPIFIALVPFAIVQPSASFLSSALIAKGDSTTLLKWRVVSIPLILLGLAIGINWGPIGIAASYALSGLFIRMPLFMAYTCRHSDIAFKSLLSYVTPSILACSVASILPLYLFFNKTSLSYWVAGTLTLLNLIIFIIVLLILPKGRTFVRILHWIKGSKNKNNEIRLSVVLDKQ